MSNVDKKAVWNNEDHIRKIHNGVNYILDQIETHLSEEGFTITPRTLKYLYTYGITISNLINEKGYANSNQVCDLLRICSILRHFGKKEGFDGNLSESFYLFICGHVEHDSGNTNELSEEFKESYSTYL